MQLTSFVSTAAVATMLAAGTGVPARATNYYVDPVAGDIGNDGSPGSPWNTLEAVAAAKSFAAGDTILLRSGYHGQPVINGVNTADVVIMPQAGDRPVLKSVTFGSARHWVLDGVTVTPSAVEPYEKVTLATFNSGASFITVQNCSLYSEADASAWTQSRWLNDACRGVYAEGGSNTIRNNLFKNVSNGIVLKVGADSCLVEYNSIVNFADDGIRGLGDYCVYQYNVVKNCYNVDGNHDDAFQSWSEGYGKGTIYGVVLRGNYFLNRESEDQPFKGALQGIGLFDGMFEDWRIENNLIITGAWNGIAIYGATNCSVVNNTVITRPGASSLIWILIADHKDGMKSTGNVVRNNLSTDLDLVAGTVSDHNIGSALAKACVNDYNNFDFSPKPGLPYVIDAGTTAAAPALDIRGAARPLGTGIDLGCYEYDGASPVRYAGYRAPVQAVPACRIGPLPIRNRAHVNIVTEQSGTVELRLFDGTGRSAARFSYAVTGAGMHALPFDAAQLQQGMALYAVSFDGGIIKRGSLIIVQ